MRWKLGKVDAPSLAPSTSGRRDAGEIGAGTVPLPHAVDHQPVALAVRTCGRLHARSNHRSAGSRHARGGVPAGGIPSVLLSLGLQRRATSEPEPSLTLLRFARYRHRPNDRPQESSGLVTVEPGTGASRDGPETDGPRKASGAADVAGAIHASGHCGLGRPRTNALLLFAWKKMCYENARRTSHYALLVLLQSSSASYAHCAARCR